MSGCCVFFSSIIFSFFSHYFFHYFLPASCGFLFTWMADSTIRHSACGYFFLKELTGKICNPFNFGIILFIKFLFSFFHSLLCLWFIVIVIICTVPNAEAVDMILINCLLSAFAIMLTRASRKKSDDNQDNLHARIYSSSHHIMSSSTSATAIKNESSTRIYNQPYHNHHNHQVDRPRTRYY